MIKINNKKICQYILLSAFLFCLSLFFGSSAKAEAVVLTPVDNYITIPDYSGFASLICTVGVSDMWSTYGRLSIDGNAMTVIYEKQNTVAKYLSYLKYDNPPVGSQLITITQGSPVSYNCIFVEGEILNTFQTSGLSYPDGNVGNNLITIRQNRYWSAENPTSTNAVYFGNYVGACGGGECSANYYFEKTIENDPEVINVSGISWEENTVFIELSASVQTSDYVLAYPTEPYYAEIGGDFNIPFVYDICQYTAANPTSTISVNVAIDGIQGWQTLTGCSGAKTFTAKNLATAEHLDYASTLFIYDETLDQEIVVSNEFMGVIYEIVGSETYLQPLPGIMPVEFPPNQATSTLPFIYSFCNQPYYNETNEICLISRDYGNQNPSDFCFTTTSCGGLGSLDITSFNNGFSGMFRLDLFNASSSRLYLGEDFTIKWLSDETQTDENTLFGKTTEDLACTQEEWESESSLTVFKCQTINTFLKLYNSVVNWISFVFKRSIEEVVKMFPLNIPVNILNSWNNAQTATLNEDLDFLVAYEDNNSIVGYMPKEWLGTASNTDLVIFSESQMTQGSSEMSVLFANFKKFTVWFQWILFVLGFILWSRQVYQDLSNNTHKDE